MKCFKRMIILGICMLLCLSLANKSYGYYKTLAVPAYSQQPYSNWCWNACSSMVLAYYGFSVSQYTISCYAVGCGVNATNDVCCCDTCVNGILNHFGSLSTSWNNELLWSSCISEIYSGERPFIMQWDIFDSGVDHALIARGVDDNTELLINDPWDGTSWWMSYSYAVYGANHSWDYTLTINSPTNRYLDYSSDSGVNNIVTILKGCEHPTIVEMWLTATCRGAWWVDVTCGNWSSNCATGWILQGSGNTGNPCECQ